MPSSSEAPASGIVLLHLSDLHFGNKNRFQHLDTEGLKAFGQRFSQAVLETLADDLNWKPSVDLIVVSGDIAEVAKPKEFDQGHAFLTAMREELQLPPGRTIFVPGNHDYNWSLCKQVDAAREIYEFDDAEYLRRINAVKFQFYTEFLEKFYGCGVAQLLGRTPLDANCGAYLCDFTIDGRRLSFAALNTSETETHKTYGGELGEAQAKALMATWMSKEYNDAVKIAVVHHNPLNTPPENRVWTEQYYREQIQQGKLSVDPDWLAHYTADMVGLRHAERLQQIVFDTGAHLVLHGHHHNPTFPTLWPRKSGGVAPILSVGSFGLQPGQIPTDQPLTCQLILLRTAPEPRLIARPLEFDPNYRLTGTLDKGQFRFNPKSAANYDGPLPPPPIWKPDTQTPSTSNANAEQDSQSTRLQQFVEYYRKHTVALHSSYDLKNLGVLPGEIRKTAAPQLDELYLPLRFAKTFDINEMDKGQALDVAALLRLLTNRSGSLSRTTSEPAQTGLELSLNQQQRERSLSIMGNAGAGKTTWMRYTFRRMREDDHTLPFLIELRSVAKFWQETAGYNRTIEAYLEHWLAEYAPDYRHSGIHLRDILKAQTNWLPVLLVDGWDELGDLGREFREKLLGMMAQYPRLLVIASSRPYGTDRPRDGDGFAQLQVQPLSETEIAAFALNFYHRCYGDEEVLAQKQKEALHAALARSQDAQQLAKTPLLLTMMLFINRLKRLPDKRHQLYQECLLSLLSERPGMQMDEGARLQTEEWCPEVDGPKRLQIVAYMAYSLQVSHAKEPGTNSTTPIAVAKEKLKRYLPETWAEREKDGFLCWLCGRAGVMVDNTDDNIWFAHLSFQEFLTAWYMYSNFVGAEATTRFKAVSDNPTWWETGLLWAALLNDQSQERAAELMQAVLNGQGLLLAGMMLAAGIGTDAQMEVWSQAFADLLCQQWPEQLDRCLRVWQASRQEARRARLCAILRETAAPANWIAWLRLKQALEGMGDRALVTVQNPESARQAPIALLTLAAQNQRGPSARLFAGGRALSGISPIWPGYPEGLLHLWPSHRRRIGLSVQRMSSMDANRDAIKKYILRLMHVSYRDHSLSLALAHALDRALARTLARELDIVLARAHTHEIDRALARELARELDVVLIRALAHDINLARDLDLVLARARDLSSEDPSQTLSVLAVQLPLASTLRRSLSYLRIDPSHRQEDAALPVVLMIPAARASILGEPEQQRLVDTIDSAKNRNVDPLWIALARHVARISTQEDRELLEDLAAHPEKREAPLSWGLQYIVRGDVLMADGSEVTLDELCDEAGVPRYPLLEEMPPEIGEEASAPNKETERDG
jgi:calcineurin-like phosphoesterase family protein